MHIDVLIPTWDRLVLLEATVKTILDSTHKDTTIFVVIDGNPKLLPIVNGWPVAVLYNQERRDWIYSINRALQYAQGDGVFYASDDLVFPPTLLGELVVAMESYFPDGDGLIGIKQNPTGVDSAFGLMGRKFIDHFPNRHAFCPDFVHYGSDFEIGRYARVHKKFFFCDTVTLLHHRCFDSTRSLAQKIRQHDRGISVQRRAKDLIWGTTFERVADGGIVSR